MLREFFVQLFRHPHYKLLSFAIALFAWGYVQLEQVGEAEVRAKVVWQLPPGLSSVDQLPRRVELSVRGTGADIRRARAARVELPVDLRTIGSGEHQVEFGAFRPEGLPEGLEILGCSPSSMTFRLDELVTRKVSVEPVHVGEPASGYLVGDVSVEPAVVALEGPRGVVAALTQVKTRPVEVSGLSADARVPVELELPRAVGLVAGTELTAVVSVVPELERRTFSAVPVVAWQQSGWTTEPGTVEVILEGPAEALAKVPADEVVAFVHLPDTPDRARYEAPWGPKEGVRLRVLHGVGDAVEVVRVEPARVEVVRR